MDANSFAASGAWIAQALYTVGLVPQVITNFRLQQGSGLSELWLFGYLNMYIAMLFYVGLIGLPPAYMILVPMQTALVLILIAQRLWYDRSDRGRQMGVFYLLNIALAIVLIPYAQQHSYLVGMYAGWFNAGLGTISQGAQVVKVFFAKSVIGFDAVFVTLIGIAGGIECVSAIVGGFPMQTVVGSGRVFFMTLIYCYQFWIYQPHHA